jgi:hypothetical protein
MSEKWELTVYSISHCRHIFAHIQVRVQGQSWGWGKSHCIHKIGRKSVHSKSTAVYLPNVSLIDL